MNKDKMNWWRVCAPLFTTFSLVFGYAYIRYVYYKGVDPIHIPMYILNKTFAVSGVILMSMSYLGGPLAFAWPGLFYSQLVKRKYYGLLGFALTCTHLLCNAAIFGQAYFKKFFLPSGKLNFTGELSLMFGTLTTLHLAFIALISIPVIQNHMDQKQWRFIQKTGMVALLGVVGHVAAMGFKGWLKPETWPGGMPPLTIVSAGVIVGMFTLRYSVIFYGRVLKPKFQQFEEEIELSADNVIPITAENTKTSDQGRSKDIAS